MNDRVQEMLELVGLAAKADLPFMKYSSGQQQQLALARTLLPGPRVLLMDEPTRSLDPVAAAGIRKFVRQTLVDGQGKTVLWCTHNLQEADEICNGLAIIHQGRLIAAASAADIASMIKLENRFRLKLDRLPAGTGLDDLLVPESIISNNGFVEIEIIVPAPHFPEIVKQLVDSGINVYHCTRTKIDLETIFEKLTRLNR
jgi:ABC-2 type transport system ATP-binding protein